MKPTSPYRMDGRRKPRSDRKPPAIPPDFWPELDERPRHVLWLAGGGAPLVSPSYVRRMMTEEDLRRMRGCGAKSARQILAWLADTAIEARLAARQPVPSITLVDLQ